MYVYTYNYVGKNPKSCQNLWTLRTHLTGVLIHGSGNHYLLQWLHDCNLTLLCIMSALIKISKTRVLPPKLFIQMDNCICENKNKYVWIFLLLIEMSIFNEVGT